MFDAIVVGAGPAGSTAAARLSQLGRRVLLLDRVSFPRDKTCGDAIQAGAIELLRELGYREPLDSTKFHAVTDWTIEAPNRRVVAAHLDTHGHDPYIARRIAFDQLVFDQALHNGAQFCQAQVTAPIIENGRVVGVLAKDQAKSSAAQAVPNTAQEFRAPLVIAADGATSAIGRALNGSRGAEIHWSIAIRCYADMRDDLQRRCEFYFPKNIMPGYAWLFPTGERTANIGVGLRLDKYRQSGVTLDALLTRFLDMLGGRVIRESVTEIKTWQLPFGSSRQSRVFDGCILVGDAGSFIDPLLGAGIYNAMRTGTLAAQTGHDALTRGDTSRSGLIAFDAQWKRSMGWGLRRATWVQRLVVGHPWLMNAVFLPASLHPVLGRQIVMMLSGEKI